MKSYFITFRLGPAVDLARHYITVTASSMVEAAQIVDRKLYLRYPNYRLVSVQPIVDLPIPEDLGEGMVERLRAER
jgi:hypothetical protein